MIPKIKSIAVVLFSVMMLYSCEEPASEKTSDTVSETVDSETTNPDVTKDEIQEEEVIKEQTVDERILEIKDFYSKIQASPNQNKNCINKSKTTYEGFGGDDDDEKYPFENKAKECQLEDGLMFQRVDLGGYEWGETCNFYYKDGKCFFVFISGGAEAYGYEYRVYYNREGDVIRVLLAENDFDGEEVSASIEVTDNKKKKEILDAVAYAEKEVKSILEK